MGYDGEKFASDGRKVRKELAYFRVGEDEGEQSAEVLDGWRTLRIENLKREIN
jgi:hypothetical protein